VTDLTAFLLIETFFSPKHLLEWILSSWNAYCKTFH
jgi:hypothetical protein